MAKNHMRFSPPDDNKLLEGCLAQDKGAWDAFVDRYSRLISHAIVQTLQRHLFTPKNQVVDDLFQSVFLALIEHNCRKLRQFQGKCKFSSWLHIVTVHLTIDYLRKKQEPLQLDDGIDETIPNGNPLPDVLIEIKEQKMILEKIKKDLTSRERLFAKLCYDLELPTAEIVRILNITENNVYQLKNRVREKMKKIVGRYYKNLKTRTS